MRTLVIILTLVLLAGVFAVAVIVAGGVLYFGEDHEKFLAFKADRDAWHRRCDVYIERPVTTPAAQACQDELKALLAYGKRQGW